MQERRQYRSFHKSTGFISDRIYNFAWGYQHHGWLIDSSGNVRGYKMPEKWSFEESAGHISLELMCENLQQMDTILCKIDKDTLQEYFGKLIHAASGEVTKPKTEMYDAGSTLFSGYLLDPTSGKYKQVLIKQFGDVFIENKSKEANQIYNWMLRINHRNAN